MHHLLLGAGALALVAIILAACIVWRLLGAAPDISASDGIPRVTIGGTMVGIKRAELSAVVTRADGTVEDLGVIAASDFPEPGLLPALKRIGAKLCRKA